MTPASPSPPAAAPLAALTRRLDAWGARRRWLTRRSLGMAVLDVVLLVLLLVLLFAPALPLAWFTATDPVFTMKDESFGTGQETFPVGQPFAVEDRQTYRILFESSANPTYFLQVMDAQGKPIHGWRESVSYEPLVLDAHFRPRGEQAAGPVQFRATVTPSDTGQTLPFMVAKLEVFPFNRVYFELGKVREWLALILLCVLPIYYYLRHVSPMVYGTGGTGYAQTATALGGVLAWLHGLGGPLREWREMELPEDKS